jgi:hypothetical protein
MTMTPASSGDLTSTDVTALSRAARWLNENSGAVDPRRWRETQ